MIDMDGIARAQTECALPTFSLLMKYRAFRFWVGKGTKNAMMMSDSYPVPHDSKCWNLIEKYMIPWISEANCA